MLAYVKQPLKPLTHKMRNPTMKVNAVKGTHPAAQTPAAGSDNYKINGGTYLKGVTEVESPVFGLESECLKAPTPGWLACRKTLQKEHID